MKRIAAIGALAVTMLAVPAAGAMASTGHPGSGGPGPGYGRPGPLPRVVCPPAHRKVRTKVLYRLHRRHGGKPVTVRISCPEIPAKPLPRTCRPGLLRFDLATGSSTLTEVSGPILAPTQEFTYRGDTYTIMSVNPGADSFTVFKDGFLFVNKGTAITDGTGFMICSR